MDQKVHGTYREKAYLIRRQITARKYSLLFTRSRASNSRPADIWRELRRQTFRGAQSRLSFDSVSPIAKCRLEVCCVYLFLMEMIS